MRLSRMRRDSMLNHSYTRLSRMRRDILLNHSCIRSPSWARVGWSVWGQSAQSCRPHQPSQTHTRRAGGFKKQPRNQLSSEVAFL